MDTEEKKPLGQRLMDNIWLLLALGLLIPILSYTIWGIIEMLTMGEATLP